MQIAIKYVNFPRVGSSGKYGNIVGQDGTKIMVPIDLLPHFRAGTIVDIATKQQTWGDSPVIVATSAPGGAYTGGVQGRADLSGGQYGMAQQGAQRANAGFQPQVIQGGGGGPVGMPAGVDQAKQIFITGVVGRAMGSGKFAASEVLTLTEAAAEAYDRLAKGALRQPQQLLGANQWPEANQRLGGPPDPEPGDPGPEMA